MRLIVNFQEHTSWMISTMAEDCRTALGPYIRVASKETMLRLFRYLGANDADMAGVDQELRQWNRGSVHLDVPNEKLKLLRVNYAPAAAQAAAQQSQPKSSGLPTRSRSKSSSRPTHWLYD